MADTGLKPVGVELVAKNQAGFTQAIGGANTAVAGFGQAALLSRGSTVLMGAAMGVVSTITMGVIGAVQSAIGAIGGLITATEQVTAAMFNKALAMEQVRMGLESLAAREQLSSGMASDMNEAMAQAIPITRDLMNRIRALDEVSPFGYEDVMSVFRTNMAFGQTIDTSLKLTKAITDIAAASGQGAYIMQRLAYNFSQMNNVGQITMRDFRDLAMAGFDLARMLREELGMSIKEVNAALKSGEITMQQVSDAFVSYADKNFGGAAARMAKTITGVKSSFEGLFTVVSTDIFSGAVSNLGVALSNVYDFASKIVKSGVFQVLGVVFEVLTSVVSGASEKIPKLNDSMLGKMGDQFMEFAERAFGFGLNIMEQFAYGFIDGASFVWDAVMYMVSGVTALLMPGSPPKAMPNLPKWGAAAMLEYLKGFTKVDFDILKDIQRPIQQALSLLELTGAIDPMKSASLYAGFSKAIAGMLASGTIDQKVLNQLTKTMGSYGAEISKLTGLQLQYAIATKAVEASQKKEQAAYSTLAKKVYEYNKLVKEGADAATLAAKKKEVDAAVTAADLATAERSATEEKYSNIEALKEQIELQKELVDQMIEIARMQAAAAKKAAAGGGGGGDGMIPTPGGGFDAAISAWEIKLMEFRDRLKLKLDTIMFEVGEHFKTSSIGKLLTAIGQAFNLFGMGKQTTTVMAGGFPVAQYTTDMQLTGIQNLYKILTGENIDLARAEEFRTLIDSIGTVIRDKFKPEIIDPATESLGKFFGGFALIVAAGVLTWVWTEINKIVFWQKLWTLELERSRTEWGKLKEFWEDLKQKIDELRKKLIELDELALQRVQEFFSKNWVGEGSFLKKVADGFAGIATAISDMVGYIGDLITAVLSGNWQRVLELLGIFTGHSPAPLAVGLESINDQLDQFSARLPDLAASVNGQYRPLAPAYAGATYNTAISVTGSMSNEQDVHRLAYIIAQEFNKRVNR